MKWWNKFIEWGWRHELEADKKFDDAWNEHKDDVSIKPEVIDMMKDDVDPNDISIENAYKTRWIWYHTILAIGIFFTNIILLAILLLLAIKL